MSESAYCDVLVPRNQRYGSLAEYRFTYCGCEMMMTDSGFVCPKHGEYLPAIEGQKGLSAYEKVAG